VKKVGGKILDKHK